MTFIEDIHHENRPKPVLPRRRAAVVTIVENPFAGNFKNDLQSAMDDLNPFGLTMADMLIEAMGGQHGVDG